jgi:adenylate cyclase
MALPEPSLVRAQLERILTSQIFSQSRRLTQFLQHVVNAAAGGGAESVKEYAIGVEVFGRGADFDPRIDTIVRVQAAKLRSKLLEYYSSEGAADPVVISIPKGGYSAVFESAVPAKRTEPTRSSIAILPFVNLSGEPENEYFRDGLTEEIINVLTNVRGLRVVARTSVFRFKGQTRDIREIGGQLNVDTILEGSVRKAGVQLRITAQLINVEDGYHLWSQTFKRQLGDIFDVQEEISEAVRSALTPHFGGDPAPQRAKGYVPDIPVHELYLKGRYAQARRVGGSVEQAVALFDQAIAADPRYARAYSGLADAWFFLGYWGIVRPHEAIPKAKAAALQALELDDHLAEAHASLGVIQASFDWNWEQGRRSIEGALELDPDFALGFQAYANRVLAPPGRITDAIAALRKSISLDPFLPNPQATLTLLLGIMGRIEEAENQHIATIATNPTYFFSDATLAVAYEANGYFAEALEAAITCLHASQGLPQVIAGVARIQASGGKTTEAKENLSQLLRSGKYIAPTDLAAVYCALDDRAQALAWLARAVDEKSVHLFFLPIDPRFRRLHKDPELQAILLRVGLQPVVLV